MCVCVRGEREGRGGGEYVVCMYSMCVCVCVYVRGTSDKISYSISDFYNPVPLPSLSPRSTVSWVYPLLKG